MSSLRYCLWHADTILDQYSGERAEPHGKALGLTACLHPNPHLWSYKLWVVSERTRSGLQMRFLQRIAGLSLGDTARSSDIWRELAVEPQLLGVELSQLRWFGI